MLNIFKQQTANMTTQNFSLAMRSVVIMVMTLKMTVSWDETQSLGGWIPRFQRTSHALKTKAARSSETLVPSYQSIRCHIQKTVLSYSLFCSRFETCWHVMAAADGV